MTQASMDFEKDQTEEYEAIGRATCRNLQALMGEGWRSPFTVSVTDADDELLFELRYENDGDGSGPGHFASPEDSDTLLREVKFPVVVSITDAGGQVTIVTLQQEGSIQ